MSFKHNPSNTNFTKYECSDWLADIYENESVARTPAPPPSINLRQVFTKPPALKAPINALVNAKTSNADYLGTWQLGLSYYS